MTALPPDDDRTIVRRDEGHSQLTAGRVPDGEHRPLGRQFSHVQFVADAREVPVAADVGQDLSVRKRDNFLDDLPRLRVPNQGPVSQAPIGEILFLSGQSGCVGNFDC